MSLDKSMLLYGITDRSWLNGHRLADCVELALKGGITMLQLREKNLSFSEFLSEANEIKPLCRSYGVPLIINDNIDVAVACGADGVHVGQSDAAAEQAREKLGTGKIIGVSVRTARQALLAEKNGADYLGVGAVFPTSSKSDAVCVSIEVLKEICAAVKIPVCAIGGITADNLPKLDGSGINGIAVISAIFGSSDIIGASSTLLKLSQKYFSEE